MKNKFIVVMTTAPSKTVAGKITTLLLSKKLAACVQILPGMESHYLWKGKREKSREILLLIKTSEKCYARLEKEIQKHHPYEVPEIIALPIIKGSKSYLVWLAQCTITE